MVNEQRLQDEIEWTISMMETVRLDEKDYLIGKLAGLLWVAGQLRIDARRQAETEWDQAQNRFILRNTI